MEADGDGLESEVQAHHIKKRALKNKALSVSFNEKDLSDFVTGFHKRKKKRRKEAQNQQQEALRRKRIELRKKRKEDRDYVLYGGARPGPDAEPNENDEVEEAEDDDEDDDGQKTSVSGTKVYANGSVKVMVTTSVISREDDTLDVNQRIDEVPKSNSGPEKKQNLPVIKKKPFKKVEKRRARPKTLTKRDKRMGKKVEKRR